MKLDRVRSGPGLSPPAIEEGDPCDDGGLAGTRHVPGSLHLTTPTGRRPRRARGRGRRRDHVRAAVSDDQPEVGTGFPAHERHRGRHAEDMPLERKACCPQPSGSGAPSKAGNRRIAKRKQPWPIGERAHSGAFAATVDGCEGSSVSWFRKSRHARNCGRGYHYEGEDDEAPHRASHDFTEQPSKTRCVDRGHRLLMTGEMLAAATE